MGGRRELSLFVEEAPQEREGQRATATAFKSAGHLAKAQKALSTRSNPQVCCGTPLGQVARAERKA